MQRFDELSEIVEQTTSLLHSNLLLAIGQCTQIELRAIFHTKRVLRQLFETDICFGNAA